MRKILNKNVLIYFVLIITSFLYVLFNTAMSPLFDASYITHDASVFYVIGRGMKEGFTPYKDLFDHKGIYIYFLYYLAALIGENYSIGLFIVFSLLVSIFTIFVYKIVRIYKDEFISFFTAITISMISISTYYSHGSLLCEYVALITMLISAYVLLKYYLQNNNELGFKPIYMFINGILAAINIFCKANYAMYFATVGLIVFIDLVFIKKDIKLLIKNILAGVIGVAVGFLPGIIYCVFTGCLDDMIFAVFTFNFGYVDDISIDLPEDVKTKTQAFMYTLRRYTNSYLIVIVSVITLIYKKVKKNLLCFYLSALFFVTISIFLALTGYTHYASLLIPFMIPAIILFYTGFENVFLNFNKNKFNKLKSISSLLALFLLIFSMAYLCGGEQLKINFFMTAQEAKKIKKVVRKYVNLNKDTKLLCLGFGTANYNYFGVIPNEKYFYIPGISQNKFNMPVKSLRRNLENFESDVILYGTNDELLRQIGDEFENTLNDKYVLVYDITKYKKIFVRKEIVEGVDIEND